MRRDKLRHCCDTMFSLVKFDSGEHYVLPSKRVKIIQGKNCVIKYKNGGKYSGCLIDVSESEEKLKKLQEEIKSFQNIKEKESDQCVAKEKDGVQLIPFSTVINEETLCRPFIQMPNILDSSTINDSISNQNVHLISSSTPINNKISCDSNIQLSTTLNKQYDTADNNQATDTHTQLDIIEKNVMENNINKSFISESSSAPSGITDIINNIGNDWMTSAENDLNNNDNNYDNQDRDQESIINNEYNHSDEIVKDSDYVLNSDELTKNQDSSINKNSTNSNNTHNSSQSHSKEDSSMENSSLQNVPPIDIRNVEVPCSKDSSSKQTVKKYFCTYCKKLQTKFARHLELKHKTESDVQKFIHIKKGTHERAKIIAAIRNHGSLLHNTHHELNTGVLITARQRQAKYKKSADDYICCTNCNGFYSKLTIRLHFSKCKTTHKKGVREITVMGKRLTGYIHTSANEVLRKIIFPVLRDDKVTRCIKYDELLILFGNKLCERYTNTHQHDMIRAHLRLLGRYKLAVQDINKEIDDFQLIFRPQNFNTAVKALRIVAKWEASIMWFKTPAVANTLTTLLKKCAATLQAECIRKQDYKTKQAVDDFLILWRDEVPTLINRKAIEDQIKYKRQKKVILPSKQDIKLLYDYLKKQCKASLNILEKNFDLSSWKTLTQCTLILVQIFNRRRAGEIERLTITDYKNQEILDKNVNPDIYEKLSEESRQYAKKFARITIRGKLGRTVPVLLNALVIKSIDTILKYRNKAGIKSNNEYIFSVLNATKLKKKYLRACPLMRKFSQKCGATIPSSLRGTTLRKQIATYTAMLNIEDTQVDNLANFMGHAKEIHKNIYRMPIPVKEMTDVSRLLEAAMGNDSDADDDGDNDDNISDTDSALSVASAKIAQRNDYFSNSDNDFDDNNAGSSDHNENSSHSEYYSDSQFEKTNCNDKKKQTNSKRRRNSQFEKTNCNDKKKQTNSKRRHTPPYGQTKRIKWDKGEKDALSKHFGNILKLPQLPSLEECQTAINKYKILKKRQPQHVKSWIDNQRRAANRKKAYQISKLLK